VVTRQLQVERGTGKVRPSKTAVLHCAMQPTDKIVTSNMYANTKINIRRKAMAKWVIASTGMGQKQE